MALDDEAIQLSVIDITSDIPVTIIARQLVEAAANNGFFYIKNTGQDIPPSAIENMFCLSEKFFASPVEEKTACKIHENVNRGWVGMHTETLDAKNQRVGDFKEAFNLAHFVDGKAQQALPLAFLGHEHEIEQFQQYCYNLVLKILSLLATGLEIQAENGGSNWLVSRHRIVGTGSSILRLLHYPPITSDSDYQDDIDIRAGSHTDYGSITLLFQRPGQAGLEVLRTQTKLDKEGNEETYSTWEPVSIVPRGTESDPSPPILINIGDLLSYWTNNLFKSTIHRVVIPRNGRRGGEDRYSIAYFGHPIDSTILEPIPSHKIPTSGGDLLDNQIGVRAMTAGEHLSKRLKASYLGICRKGDEK
ncbi:unnamed protein product [Blumeria hordei]|uniref:Fe2OG dioxygenase domain-containing protein n=1 Tax=Blumeria hordei TaxID=2867405 RepID=A0A383UK22_BLUHO|nr:unnamed protein product [Blumeria hordei]